MSEKTIIDSGNIYVGETDDGTRIVVRWEVSRKEPQTFLTTDHQPVQRGTLIASITYEELAAKRVSTTDGRLVSLGAGADDAVRRVSGFGGLPKSERDELAAIAERWHLNDLRAACAHMPDKNEIQRRADNAGADDWVGWAIDHIACPETGYRWGTAWLVEPLPAHVATRLRAMTREANADDVVIRGRDLWGNVPSPRRVRLT